MRWWGASGGDQSQPVLEHQPKVGSQEAKLGKLTVPRTQSLAVELGQQFVDGKKRESLKGVKPQGGVQSDFVEISAPVWNVNRRQEGRQGEQAAVKGCPDERGCGREPASSEG